MHAFSDYSRNNYNPSSGLTVGSMKRRRRWLLVHDALKGLALYNYAATNALHRQLSPANQKPNGRGRKTRKFSSFFHGQIGTRRVSVWRGGWGALLGLFEGLTYEFLEHITVRLFVSSNDPRVKSKAKYPIV
jgi:hypothetical protein